MAPSTTGDYKLFSDSDLKEYVIKLGLDPVGPRSTLLDRVSRHLALNETANGVHTGSGANGVSKGDKEKKPTKRRKKKAASAKLPERSSTETAKPAEKDEIKVEVEYITAPIEVDDPLFADYNRVFAKFTIQPEDEEETGEGVNKADGGEDVETKSNNGNSDLEDSDEEGEDANGEMSKKKLRKLNRLSVAELKQLVRKPEVVDWVDVTAADPKLLVHLKSYRNTVPVPVHWSQKRKYLQGKRGIEKPPFALPDFIVATGIMEMRSAVRDKEDTSKLKTKTRERMQPKMGKLDIDYQKLHDAFFRWQTKPKLTIHGDLYYEGKEFETKLKAKKPGQLSEELKAALSMPPLAPPPWLINMQRYGPPPSYPQLKIPGLSAPIPEGAQWGFHPGGWGRPPVDEYGRPLYGDVFGTMAQTIPMEHVAPIERARWGELEVEEEEEEESEQEEEDEDEDEEAEEDEVPESGLVTPSGMSSVPSGLETPEHIELRKESRRNVIEEPKQLYTVVPEKQGHVKGFMGSQHVYDLSEARGTKRKGAVEVSLNPEDLQEGLDEDTIKRKYDQQLNVSKAETAKEDFSDMVAEHAQKQNAKKQKKEKSEKGKQKEKFKF
ncbi:hypothetical protein DFS34DRAFT_98345 [Phlyctochytrium arcticum]|nr:hypothetical protein DFS34DRAFT_98345 [Phlyctochytrium arcticum]